VIALLSVIILYLLGLLGTSDVGKISWATLLLFGGGLTLGAAIDSSGFAGYLGTLFADLIAGQPYAIILGLVAVFSVFMTLSASNTATAALLVPVIIPLASALNLPIKTLAVTAGVATSLDFLVPVGTPPSAIAYSSGYIRVKDMVKAGIPITIAGIIMLTLVAWAYWALI
jgi:sodium-dependent dicarboxylate transporter 2/3/5